MNHDNSKRLIGIISTNSKYNIELNHLKDNMAKNEFLNYIYLLNINNQSYCCVQCYEEIKSNEVYDITNQVFFFLFSIQK